MKSIPAFRWTSGSIRAALGAAMLFASGCATPCRTSARSDALTQVSVINALLAGDYAGGMKCGDLTQYGDFGLGTFDALDGEMAVLDGRVYAIRSDGRVREVNPSERTPFAAVTFFDADEEFDLIACNQPKLQEQLQARLPSENWFYAIRIRGTFDYVKTRSVPRQAPPYRPLAVVVQDQVTFEFRNVEGELLGFWTPAYANSFNAPGWHFHFMAKDRSGGGHLLDVRVRAGRAQVDRISELVVKLPATESFLKTDLAPDRGAELHRAETDPARAR